VAHILFLTFHLPRPHEPGAARPWEELQLMRELGLDVTVITASTHYLTEQIDKPVHGLWRKDVEDGVTIIRTWSPTHYRRSFRRRVLAYLAYSLIIPLAALSARGVDAVFTATDPPFMTPPALLTAWLHGARLVLDERDIYPETLLWVGIRPPRPILTVWFAWSKWLRERASGVVTVSPGFVRLVTARGARPESTYFITNYFPRGDPGSDPPPAVTGDAPMTVLYAGGLGESTDVHTILGAAVMLRDRGLADRFRFLFVGAGERREEYIERARREGLINVAFPGSVPRNEIDSIFAGAHVALHSLGPQYQNSLSSKIFEYMAHARPVLFAGEGDIAEVLAESGGGVTVEPGNAAAVADALACFLAHPERIEEMGSRARAYVAVRFNRSELRERLGRALGVSGVRGIPPGVSGSDVRVVEDASSWDALVAAAREGEIFHTSAWLQLIADVYGVEAVRLGLFADGELVGGFPFHVRRMGPFRIAGSPLPGVQTPQMGPVVLPGIDPAAALDAFDGFMRQERIAACHLVSDAPTEPALLAGRQYSVEPHATMVLDLDGRSEEDIWKGFKSECRTAIRKAEKSGVEVTPATDLTFLPEYLAMAQAVFARHGRLAPVPAAFYQTLWERFSPDGTLRVLLARHEGEIVAGAMFLAHGRRLYYLDGVSHAQAYGLRANNLIQWSIIRWGLERGCTAYDLVGADTPELIRFKSTLGAQLHHHVRARRTNSRLAAAAMASYLRARPLVRAARFRLAQAVSH
jgi:colanic acid biosynthesis glycosyl transferase WcaI